ncbi:MULTISPECIES: class F sortase [unclassified Streptomyces]|uniref:class F sortase n=1 Tax=unclassified Streptomyces TaxID=2593676 RepID=UPI00165648F1|nr:class F sortase [Streptomyces sp. CB02980]MCB8905476.1 class F sortase [Streptomyces sp. CB02980]
MKNGSGPKPDGAPPRRVPSVRALACTTLLGIVLLAHVPDGDGSRPPTTTAQASTLLARPAAGAERDRPVPRPLPASDAARIRIPAIGIDVSLVPLELDGAGALRPPPATAPTVAGWYADGTAPGAPGTAVVAGHVDTPLGPAVFHRLDSLSRGAGIEIDRVDGRTALFTVDAVELHPKDRFPDDKVYGGSGRPELRLITCGGEWSSDTGYRANTVVYATLTGTR